MWMSLKIMMLSKRSQTKKNSFEQAEVGEGRRAPALAAVPAAGGSPCGGDRSGFQVGREVPGPHPSSPRRAGLRQPQPRARTRALGYTCRAPPAGAARPRGPAREPGPRALAAPRLPRSPDAADTHPSTWPATLLRAHLQDTTAGEESLGTRRGGEGLTRCRPSGQVHCDEGLWTLGLTPRPPIPGSGTG